MIDTPATRCYTLILMGRRTLLICLRSKRVGRRSVECPSRCRHHAEASRRSIVVGTALAVLVCVALPSRVAAAGQFHGYSEGQDSQSRTGTHYYSGVSVQRNDDNFTTASNSQCTYRYNDRTMYSGNVVNQAQWVSMSSDSGNWLELGTATKTCSNGSQLKWWYVWMNNPNGFNSFEYTHQITGSAQHRFFLTNGTDGYWHFYIDQTLIYQYYWPNLGFRVDAGYESWDGLAEAPQSYYNGMVKQVDWSGWQSWQANGAWLVVRVDGGSPASPPLFGTYTPGNNGYSCETVC